ncbi:MAG: hypothetical protein J0J04_08180 [Microbacterium sp.]|uniref:hypothetical protein n=1 Tax=Microbacterium sp. TaxID=51671 RepID=UPI001ACB260C|nr:hypothetical protein [Microbacterium sp.]MBN9214778.1 hypothetical protein [Microbacterium sp.]
MRLFNSRDQITFNTDPAPVLRPSDGARGGFEMRGNFLPGQSGPFGELESLLIDPRPEYTPVPHNPTSSVLTQFRQMHGARRGSDLVHAAIAWRGNLGVATLNGVYTVDEATHAARVLSRMIDAAVVPA